MTKKQAVKCFGNITNLASKLGISAQAVAAWGERPPMLRQYEIERLTKGKLKADK